ncbi:hypothetical protein OH491_06775 [Termitidicoccus mucosus]
MSASAATPDTFTPGATSVRAVHDDFHGDLLEVSMGPHHPRPTASSMNVVLDGEIIVKLQPVFGYLHRNHENWPKHFLPRQHPLPTDLRLPRLPHQQLGLSSSRSRNWPVSPSPSAANTSASSSANSPASSTTAASSASCSTTSAPPSLPCSTPCANANACSTSSRSSPAPA